MSRPGSNGPAPGNRPAPPPNPPALSLNTSQGGRRFVAEFFATELGRHDFTAYISTHLAADFACALAQHLAATGKRQVGEVQEPVSKKAVRQFIADRAPNDEHCEDILSGDYDHTLWFDHIRELMEALAARKPVAQKPERRAPVQGYHGETIPWRVHGLAWEAYARKYPGQDAEKIASRGGFAVQEMDVFLPGWRDMAEGPTAQGIDLGPLVAELAAADSEYAEAKKRYHTVSAMSGAAGGRASCRAAYEREVTAKSRFDAAVRALIDQRDATPGVGNG